MTGSGHACIAGMGRIAAAVALGLFLLIAATSGGVMAQETAPASVKVADGALILTAPKGYCVDKAASRDGKDGAFVLFGSCASLANSATVTRPKVAAILTASALPGAPTAQQFRDSFASMAKFLSSDAGRAALSRSGKAKTLRVRQIVAVGDVLYLRATDTSKSTTGEDFEPEYWRALFALNGQIVSLSVLGLADMPLEDTAKRGLLEKFVARVKAANRG